ncbi:hypothetical protein AMK26_16220 [Streptomyces sp. CB03234]|uniref:hypothetical protein n=1 Tax=Streptomyces sp. (strain CB03234) TaxID=1703937 RepID=UPI00093C4D8D|nr:hypothetical protein [Streptomyces sp. CB03234]OKK04822.1 hypothetical protein AMK26_16220 [Streptomyces sp. CB03234]
METSRGRTGTGGRSGNPGSGAAGVRLLLVETRGTDAPPDGFRADAVMEVLTGHAVLLFLVGEGVTLAVPDSDRELDLFQKEGGELTADLFSLVQRGLDEAALRPGVRVTGWPEVAGWLLDPAVRVAWH